MHDAPGSFPATSAISAPRPTGSGAVDEAVGIWRSLVALGVRDVVLSPGSRSAPLVYALQDPEVVAAGVRAHVRIDERAAAFTALGISRADPDRPGVVVTTSGTATAHLHAAVLEAHHARVPLLVLTADRPAELRDVGANQATHQAGLYGDATRFAVDLPAPTATAATPVELRTAVTTAARAFAAATGVPAGPVHLNLGFRDPLVPADGHVPGATVVDGAASADGAARPDGAAGTDTRAGRSDDLIVFPRRIRPSAPAPLPVDLTARTVVVAGDSAGPQAREFAEQHLLPLLAEPSSGARSGPSSIPGYPDLLARVMQDPAHPLRPSQAIVFGHPTLSRSVVSGLLGAPDVDVVVVDPTLLWADAARRARLVVPAICGVRADGQGPDPTPGRFLDDWQAAASAAASDALAVASSAPVSAPGSTLTWQARTALAVWRATGAEDTLLLGSSSLVRDLEQHAPAALGTVLAGRGLAGIDGTISTATGYALARGQVAGRTRVLLGDVTALHDLTGLLLGALETEPELDIVVVDDGGGRIFSGLEHRQADPSLLERFFTTPHATDIAALAEAMRVPAHRVEATPATGAAQSLSALLAERPGGRRLLAVSAPVTEPGVQSSSSSDSPGSGQDVVQ
jgi:2-succinyl-5-enolpyruvyl-6-hydroxy-3-cyclohexene-1-carboxylate synthase